MPNQPTNQFKRWPELVPERWAWPGIGPICCLRRRWACGRAEGAPPHARHAGGRPAGAVPGSDQKPKHKQEPIHPINHSSSHHPNRLHPSAISLN